MRPLDRVLGLKHAYARVPAGAPVYSSMEPRA